MRSVKRLRPNSPFAASAAAALGALLCALLVAAGGCAEIGTGPSEAAAIEMTPFPSPSVVIGDTLRNVAGVVTPIRAVVRNVSGEPIVDAPVRYLYADALRDSALAVDTATGIVRALRASKTDARLAARIGGSLQVLRSLIVTTRPDSVDRVGQSPIVLFTTTLPDTGRSGASANSSPALTVVVRHVESATAVSAVNGWPVRYELVSPTNASNDTTASVFLVDDQGRASVLDTTDAGGVAGRKVRLRAQQFPVGAAIDSVIVRAIVTYKGVVLKGAPFRLALPVRRGS